VVYVFIWIVPLKKCVFDEKNSTVWLPWSSGIVEVGGRKWLKGPEYFLPWGHTLWAWPEAVGLTGGSPQRTTLLLLHGHVDEVRLHEGRLPSKSHPSTTSSGIRSRKKRFRRPEVVNQGRFFKLVIEWKVNYSVIVEHFLTHCSVCAL